ncbi:MAG TPA: hypothetical protein VMJ35_12575 [Dongiaceae bacterium]|nr:hypothetical protein [Dongiaceae bacterium]
MKLWLVILEAFLVFSPAAYGQHGVARNVQDGTVHDTWLGIVVSTNNATREITLESPGREGAEVFTGTLKESLSIKTKDGSKRRLQPSDIPKGDRIIVFYEQKKTKADNGKVTVYNEIFRIERGNVW